MSDDEMVVKCVDANNYCRILALLGMEDEGDPVAEVRRLAAIEKDQVVGDGWIPVAEREPQSDDDMLTFGKDGIRVAMLNHTDGLWFTPTSYALRGVTHWQPLPAAPGSASPEPRVVTVAHVAPPGFGPMTDLLRAASPEPAAAIEKDQVVGDGMALVSRDLLREAKDNCYASLAEEDISDHRRQYRVELHERLCAALAAAPDSASPEPVVVGVPMIETAGLARAGRTGDFIDGYESGFERAIDRANDYLSAAGKAVRLEIEK